MLRALVFRLMALELHRVRHSTETRGAFSRETTQYWDHEPESLEWIQEKIEQNCLGNQRLHFPTNPSVLKPSTAITHFDNCCEIHHVMMRVSFLLNPLRQLFARSSSLPKNASFYDVMQIKFNIFLLECIWSTWAWCKKISPFRQTIHSASLNCSLRFWFFLISLWFTFYGLMFDT